METKPFILILTLIVCFFSMIVLTTKIVSDNTAKMAELGYEQVRDGWGAKTWKKANKAEQ